jgi:uncharacterized protein YaiI (UPF0178 family)
MAQPGETEIFALDPQKNDGICYEYAEYTREEEINESPFARYFTTNIPQYVGRVTNVQTGRAGGQNTRIDTFVDNNNNKTVITQNDRTCYRKVNCIIDSAVGPIVSAARNGDINVPTGYLIGKFLSNGLPIEKIHSAAYTQKENVKTAGKRRKSMKNKKGSKRRNKNKKGSKRRNKNKYLKKLNKDFLTSLNK